MQQPTQKKLLFISRHAPYGSSIAKEALDAVLAASAYDQDLSLLFMDDGVFQLLKTQSTAPIEQKSLAAMLPALTIFGVENIFVHSESLNTRHLSREDLVLDEIQLLNNAEIADLMTHQDHLLSF